MFEGMYSHIQRKPIRRSHILDEKLSLDDFLSYDKLNESLLIKSFMGELKSLLEINDAFFLIEALFELERKLAKLQEKFEETLPIQLTNFFEDLSPILLQKFWERRENPVSEETIDRLFLESIHIVLEEEIYIWQEKIQ